ncbi:hypothetical protein RRF57_004848 [Xylaria bambusicola]|uniref:Uncharacterized protein n=1 Tax=Xylaria bambusicola TaxID=326684 RepID=A0AAN7UKU3_9PEZI
MPPNPTRPRALSSSRRDADTRSLTSVPSLAYSETTANSVSTDFPPDKNSLKLSSLEPAAPICLHYFQPVQANGSLQKTNCESCDLNQSLLECARCAFQQCRHCYLTQNPPQARFLLGLPSRVESPPRVESATAFATGSQSSCLESRGEHGPRSADLFEEELLLLGIRNIKSEIQQAQIRLDRGFHVDDLPKEHETNSFDYNDKVLPSCFVRIGESNTLVETSSQFHVIITLYSERYLITAAEIEEERCYVSKEFINTFLRMDYKENDLVIIPWQTLNGGTHPLHTWCEVLETSRIKGRASLIIGRGCKTTSKSIDTFETLPETTTDMASSRMSSSDESSVTTQDRVETQKKRIIRNIIAAITHRLRLQFIQLHHTVKEDTDGSLEGDNTTSGKSNHPSDDQPQPSRKRRLGDRHDEGDEVSDESNINPPCLGVKGKKDKEKEMLIGGRTVLGQDGRTFIESTLNTMIGNTYTVDIGNRSSDLFVDHQRAVVPCELRDPEPIEGFDGDQETQLKARKKKSQIVSEVDKWRAAFQILFPHVPADEIPSPFYEYEQLVDVTSRSRETLTECEQYVLREIPLRLQQILTAEFDRDFQIVKQSLRTQAIEHTRTLVASLFQEFRDLRQQDTVPAAAQASQGHVDPTLSRAQSEYFSSIGIFDDVELNWDFFSNDGSMAVFEDVQLQDVEAASVHGEDHAQKHSDSGYTSNNQERPDKQAMNEGI